MDCPCDTSVTVTTEPVTTVDATQGAGQNIGYVVFAHQVSTDAWEAGKPVTAGTYRRPTDANLTGFVYSPPANGMTGAKEPKWGVVAGGSTPDGSLNWTAFVPPAPGQDTIHLVTWAIVAPPDSALALGSPAQDAFAASNYIGGGTKGSVYVVTATITMTSGAVYIVQINLTIE
jgi:hypothetical protein